MQIRNMIFLGFACAASSLAFAEESVEPATLGNFDAAIAACRQLNPAGESTYHALRASMTAALSAEALATLTQTEQYKDALEAGSKALADEPHDAVVKKCKALKPPHSAIKRIKKKHE